MKKVKVLVVDDSAFMRKFIKDLLQDSGQIEVIGIARNGMDAVEQVNRLKPDVVTMDVEMPKLNGLEAVKQIMTTNPVPIVMLSTTTTQGTEHTMIAMENGAVDFIAKPSGAISLNLETIKETLISKVLLASKANVMGNAPIKACNGNVKAIAKQRSKKEEQKEILVCIGTSTGGPRALQDVLTRIPKDIKFPILIVQHMPAGFTKSLANRLNSICEINVKEAVNDEKIENGVAYIAPGGFHLKVSKAPSGMKVIVEKSEPRSGHRPSVNVLLESVCSIKNHKVIVTIMTGMGNDGADGVKQLKSRSDTYVIAESSETAVIYGMPKAAIASQCVDEIVDLQDIAQTIINQTSL